MKCTSTILPVLIGLGGVAAGHLGQRPEVEASRTVAQDLAGRVEALEGELARSQAQISSLAGDLAEQRKLVDRTVDYLGRQAAQAEAMLGVLDDSEERGFTAGINPKSREVLLAGWRAVMAEAGRDVPGDEAADRGTTSRRR